MKSNLPPQSLNLEEAVLSACMVDNTAFLRAKAYLKSETFYKTAHQEIWSAMEVLWNKSLPIDLLTLMNALKSKGMLEKIGGAAYLAEISSKVTSSANVEYHAKVIAEKFIAREVTLLPNITEKAYRDDNDVFEVVTQLREKLISLESLGEGGKATTFGNASFEALEQAIAAKKALDQGVRPDSIVWGVQDVDSKLGGHLGGHFVIVAARPAMGKTSFALNIAREAALEGKNVVFFSLEMVSRELANRTLSRETGIPYQRIMHGKVSTQEIDRIAKAVEITSEYPIQIFDNVNTLSGITAKAQTAALELKTVGKKVDLVIVDYLQLVTDNQRGGNREQEISRISQGMKSLAKVLDCPVIALSQLSRAVEQRSDRRPQLSDLRESGSLEQDADVVTFLFRPEEYGIMEDEHGNSLKGLVEVIVGKNRHGATGSAWAKIDLATNHISDVDGMEVQNETYGAIPPQKAGDEDIPF